MSSNSEFWELYKRPEWQEKRLEIMQRADFKCEECGSKDKTLHVHHGYYERGKKPWEYPSSSLRCLCERCHEEYTCLMLSIRSWLADLNFLDLNRVHGYLIGMIICSCKFAHEYETQSREFMVGISDACHLEHNDVLFASQQREDGDTFAISFEKIREAIATRQKNGSEGRREAYEAGLREGLGAHRSELDAKLYMVAG